jgi:uncharacterized protein YdeI (BOF family)
MCAARGPWHWPGALIDAIAVRLMTSMSPNTPAGPVHSLSVSRFSKILMLAGMLSLLVACHRQTGTVLGKAPVGPALNIVAVHAGDAPPTVTLQGVIVEKCPVAGCWFYLQDQTGTIKVDTKSAGFVVVDVPLQTKVTVSGKIVSDGDTMTIAGTGLRY